MKDFIVVIPARIQSTRLPRKPLINILGKTLIERTYNQCIKAVAPELVYVATDSEEIKKHCEEIGIQVLMTSSEALTGTDRVYEASKQVAAKYYINVQGDEPVLNPDDVKKLISALDYSSEIVLNGFAPIINVNDYESTSIPKVVFRADGNLLYMSRSPIPGNKSKQFKNAHRQICIYGFPKKALDAFSNGYKTPLEKIEDIEILRFLELNIPVKMIEMSTQSIAVDLQEDIAKVERFLEQKEGDF